MVSIRKFQIIVLVSNRIEYWTIIFHSKFRIFAQHYFRHLINVCPNHTVYSLNLTTSYGIVRHQ